MRTMPIADLEHDVYSADEVARAAGVPLARVVALVRNGHVISFREFVGARDAVHLVRWLQGPTGTLDAHRSPLTLPAPPRRRGGVSLVASGFLHGAVLAALCLVTWLGLLMPNDTEQVTKDTRPIPLVYLIAPGPAGGGGGGGLHVPVPPPPAARKAPVKTPRKPTSAVPPRHPIPPPPPVVSPPPPRVDPPKPIPPPIVQAPIVPVPADPIDKTGVIAPPAPAPASNGPGAGGGTGTGSGPGLGEGRGAGIGPGSGGGTGGGPYQPGSGIDPPALVREIKPLYTEDARRRAIEGDVVLEIVVRRDGSVGDVHVVHTLEAGLDQKAIDAVRQWRFGPARRQGSPVDVVVEVSVGFKLR
jgi:protein TonB